jgi:UDP-N-acetylglucosamine 1-carboxyvinyltransferase
MDKIVIRGGKHLKGKVKISGSKNAALPILFATLLTDEECIIENVPQLADIKATITLLEFVGKKIDYKNNKVHIYSCKKLHFTAPYDLVRKMRASVLVMGPLIARLGKVLVSLPGGCAIGARPIDIHLDGFKKLGAKISISKGYVEMKCANLKGNTIFLHYPSVGATENLILAAVLANGKTIIENAAREPEIVDLANMLTKMGANIIGAGSRKITIIGVNKLHKVKYKVLPDRIETATYLIAAAITKGKITLTNTDASCIQIVIDKLRKSGMAISAGKDFIKTAWVKPLKPVSIKTDVYPGFPTDAQAQWMALMSTIEGTTSIKETVFENRFLHAVELKRLGANLVINGNTVLINGVKRLSGAPVMVSDLRAGAALVLAGLVANGETKVLRIYHLDRGYENLEKKLKAIGANIKRIA